MKIIIARHTNTSTNTKTTISSKQLATAGNLEFVNFLLLTHGCIFTCTKYGSNLVMSVKTKCLLM